MGNCGVSAVPILPSCQAEQTAYLRKISEIPVPEEAVRDASVQKYAAHVAQTGYPSHLGTLIGQGTLRAGIVGFQDRPLTPSEMEQMKFLLDDQLNQGALGLSLGLIYPPGSFSPTSELRELARVVQKHKLPPPGAKKVTPPKYDSPVLWASQFLPHISLPTSALSTAFPNKLCRKQLCLHLSVMQLRPVLCIILLIGGREYL